MQQMEIRAYRKSDEDNVVALWRQCGLVVPWNDPVKDIRRKLLVQRCLFLVGLLDDRVTATIMAGYEGHRGWINYLAVAPEFRRQGFGPLMMEEAESRLRKMGCPKINLQVRKSNARAAEFYRSIGYAEDDVLSMGKHLVED